MTSPTARSLAYCRARGWRAGVVEKWNPHAKIRQDLFGCFDLVVIALEAPQNATPDCRPVRWIIGVQATTGEGGAHAARVAKVWAAKVLPDWIDAYAVAEVWSWAKRGARGKRKKWTLRRERVTP